MKKRIFVLLACGLFLTTACGTKSNNNGSSNTTIPSNNGENSTVNVPTANTESNVVKEQVVDGLKITNISVITENGASVFTADVVNETTTAIDVLSLNVILKDAEGNEVITLLGYIGQTIAPNDSSTITANVDMDLSKVTSVEYTRNY